MKVMLRKVFLTGLVLALFPLTFRAGMKNEDYLLVYTPKVPGKLVCFVQGEQDLAIGAGDIKYLGSGEWSLLSPNGIYVTFAKSTLESCVVDPTATDEP